MNKNTLTYLLLVLAVATRFIPHPVNFTAIGAIALFSGLYLGKKQAYTLPLAAMFVSDILIGFYNYKIMFSVYVGFIAMIALGRYLRNNIKFTNIALATLAGSTLFFLLTNAAVWFFGTMYTHNLSGLLDSYYMALPFWKNEILSNMFYTTVLVGGFEMIKNILPEKVLHQAK